MKKLLIIASVLISMSASVNAANVDTKECLVDSDMIKVTVKGSNNDPLSQTAKIRLIRPNYSNDGISPVIATSEAKTYHRYWSEITFNQTDIGEPTIETGDLLIIWTENYNYHNIIHCI